MPAVSVKKICFVICPLKKPGSKIRQRTLRLHDTILKPVLQKMGYRVLLPNMLEGPYDIPIQIMEAILNVPLVIADLSDCNPNVLYELGVRHTVGKPAITFIQQNEALPFDLETLRTIFYNLRSQKSIMACKRRLREMVHEIESGEQYFSNPVANAKTNMAIAAFRMFESSQTGGGSVFSNLEALKVLLENRPIPKRRDK